MKEDTGLLTIFTDGSSRGNPGPGGFGAIVIAPKNTESGIMNYEVTEIGGREEHTTNNRMELQAAIEALKNLTRFNLSPDSRLNLYSDSSYVINGITKWIYGWQKNGWKTKTKKEVENRDLWEALSTVCEGKNIEWKQVGGHVGVAGNVRCDEIATAFADGNPPQLYSGILKNYSIKNISDIKEDTEARSEKRETRSRQNAKAYSYVSSVGGVVETHKTWAECEARVKGKPARFKKALDPAEEQALIKEWSGH